VQGYLWDVTTYSLVESLIRFGGAYYHQLQGLRGGRQADRGCYFLSTSPTLEMEALSSSKMDTSYQTIRRHTLEDRTLQPVTDTAKDKEVFRKKKRGNRQKEAGSGLGSGSAPGLSRRTRYAACWRHAWTCRNRTRTMPRHFLYSYIHTYIYISSIYSST
jgi:hypothetical protein